MDEVTTVSVTMPEHIRQMLEDLVTYTSTSPNDWRHEAAEWLRGDRG